MKTIYLDNNATTQVAPEVLETMLPYFSELYGNPSSMHSFGGQVSKTIQHARENVASLIGADPEEIIFTSCGTESDNTAIMSALSVAPDKSHIITSRVEHPAVKVLCEHLTQRGYRVTELPVDRDGRLDMELFENSLSRDTAVVSLMWANNETGVIFPVERAAQLAHERGILFHTDAVQAVGKIPINMRANNIDMLSFSGHKLHAPKGIGVLYIRKGTRFLPFMLGGHQEKGRRGGTENVIMAVGLGRAAELAAEHVGNERMPRLRDRLWEGLRRAAGDRVVLNGHPTKRLPNTLNVSFSGWVGGSLLGTLEGVYASTGAACHSGDARPSAVLTAMGISRERAIGAVRFSVGRPTTEGEIDRVVEFCTKALAS